jgi:uncharacterized caspase-like protein
MELFMPTSLWGRGFFLKGFLFVFNAVVFLLPILHAQTSPARRDVQVQPNDARNTPAPVSQWPVESKRFAMIVGVDQYTDQNISPLKAAANDAHLLSEALQRYAGFPEDNIILLTSSQRDTLKPTRNNIFAQLTILKTRLPKDGLLFFSFSGHGISLSDLAFLLPSDAQVIKDADYLKEAAVSVERLRNMINATGVRQRIVLLDACRNDPLNSRALGDNPMNNAYRALRFDFETRNHEIDAYLTLYATRLGEKAFENPDTGYGFFTEAFVDGLKGGPKGETLNPQGEIRLGALIKYVTWRVPEQTQKQGLLQQPWAESAGINQDELVIAKMDPPSPKTGKTKPEDNDTSEVALWKKTKTRNSTDGYRAYLNKYPKGLFAEDAYWETIRKSIDPSDFQSYFKKYPKGKYSELAVLRTQPAPNTPAGPALQPGREIAEPAKYPPPSLDHPNPPVITGTQPTASPSMIKRAAVPFEFYSDSRQGLSFEKPQGWTVTSREGGVFLSPNKGQSTRIFFFPILRTQSRMNAVSFLNFAHEENKKKYSNWKLLDKRMNASGTMSEIRASFDSPDSHQAMKGFYMVSLENGRGLYCGFETEAGQEDLQHQILAKLLVNLKITPDNYLNSTEVAEQSASGKNPAATRLSLDARSLQIKPSSDGTIFIAVPPDWEVEGGNIMMMATAPDKQQGVFLINDHQPGWVASPQAYLLQKLLPTFRCNQVKLLHQEPALDTMQAARGQGYNSYAINFLGTAINGDGLNLKFLVTVNFCTIPMTGAGWVSCTGVYATPPLFDTNLPILISMAASIDPNRALIMSKLQANLDRLGAASGVMSQTNEVVSAMVRNSTASTDRILDKYNYYLSGEEARYSPVENRVYVIDSNLGGYTRNSNYPQESHVPVPDTLWNQLPHERVR